MDSPRDDRIYSAMNHLKSFEAQSNEYYMEVSKEDYFALRWDPTGRHRSVKLDDRELADIESHVTKALSDRTLVVSFRDTFQGVMVNPKTFGDDFFTNAVCSALDLGRYRKFIMTISKCVFMDDEPFWAVRFFEPSNCSRVGVTKEGTERFFICDGMWGLRRMIADELPGPRKPDGR